MALVVLGIIIGLTSITVKEVQPFLIAAIALVVVSMSTDVWSPLTNIHRLLYDWVIYILHYVAAFAAPAAVIIAIKSVLQMTKD